MAIRIGGLASGMDTDSIVSELMKAERAPLDKLNQKKTYTEWQRDDYREMKTLLFDLDQLIFNGISRQSSFIKKTINSSNSDAVSIKNVSSTTDFTGSLSVHSLASAATMVSGTTSILNNDSSKKLSESSIEAQTITIKSIKSDGTLQSDSEAYKLTIDPTTDTLNSVIAKINANSGVTAFYDQTQNKISLITKNTGDAKDTTGVDTSEIVLSSTGNFFSQLSLDPDNNTAAGTGKGTVGQNSDFTYNGLRTTRPSNTFNINGVEFSLKQTTGNTSVTFSSSSDVDSVFETVKTFVTKYNEVIDKIKSNLEETKYRDYTPLTSEQKSEMSDDEIELWEEKAKSGTLRNDSILNSVLNKMRINLGSSVSGLTGFSSLSQIGISTTSAYLEGGKLEINEDKLKAAISSNPNGIYELFYNTSKNGIAQQLRQTISTAMTDIEKKAGKASSVNNTFTLGRLLNNYDDQITRLEDRLKTVENRYWKQFTAMETAVQKSNSQSSYLASFFSA